MRILNTSFNGRRRETDGKIRDLDAPWTSRAPLELPRPMHLAFIIIIAGVFYIEKDGNADYGVRGQLQKAQIEHVGAYWWAGENGPSPPTTASLPTTACSARP